ncbi:hypothetical protein A9X06_04515 [Mycobacterium sp. 852002-51759_SCH5129042]|nr:hypothetical protein A9X06_04515 [Mycobacterium sp. 852002-51759_SCH5129042]
MLVSVVSVVLGGLAIAGIAWWVLWLALGAKADTPNQLDLTKIALSVSAGVGGAVALVVAYRKQRDNERGRFAQLFGAAAAQLGNADVAVRMAGVYAMAGVADEFAARGMRQQCIDVLCGYLRLPYDPDEGATHLSSRKITDGAGGPQVERAYQLRQNDREVRRTIIAVIVTHLRPQAETSWSHCDFNFDDAVLEDVDFRWAVFAGGHTHLRGTRFIGERSANFENVEFVGTHVTFHSAHFESDALFRGTKFTPTSGERRAEYRRRLLSLPAVRRPKRCRREDPPPPRPTPPAPGSPARRRRSPGRASPPTAPSSTASRWRGTVRVSTASWSAARESPVPTHVSTPATRCSTTLASASNGMCPMSISGESPVVARCRRSTPSSRGGRAARAHRTGRRWSRTRRRRVFPPAPLRSPDRRKTE